MELHPRPHGPVALLPEGDHVHVLVAQPRRRRADRLQLPPPGGRVVDLEPHHQPGRLVETHLLEVAGQEPTGRTRYRLHDLLRGLARERLLAETTEADRKLLLDRSGADLQQVATA